jgi:hypothetical protein
LKKENPVGLDSSSKKGICIPEIPKEASHNDKKMAFSN